MKQQTLAVAAGFERFGRQTRRAEFLAEMDQIVPWRELVALIDPHYPKAGNGRPPVGLERMLRIYFLQQWFNLSDPAVEDALYDSLTMRSFAGIDLGREPAPDETTVCKFRHLLERYGLGKQMLTVVNGYLARHGLKIGTGTIVDATILHAPSSTKNKQEQRDPEMHQVKKGNQWYFGMKAHVGVDAGTKLIHSAEATAANVADSRVLPELLHGEETDVWGDQAYQGKTEVIRQGAPRAVDRAHRPYRTKLAQNFIKERTQRRMKILLGEGLITSDGETQRRQRRIAAPAFHRQRIQAYGGMMVDRCSRMRDQWKATESLDIAAEMMQLTLQIVARTLLNTDVTHDVLEINQQVNVIMDLYNFLIALPKAEAYLHLPLPGLLKFRRARGRLDAVVRRMIAEHRADGVDRGDLLSMLLASRDEEADHSGMTDEQLRDEVLTIFLAGYETVANALTWTWYLLSENPQAEARFHAELDQVLKDEGGNPRLPGLEDLPRLPYTEMVFAEAMRLYPPAWAMGRQSIADVELGPYRFPAGAYFFFSQYIVQRSKENFPDPLRFDPTRFLPEHKARRPRFAYFPFGGGSRQCIGESFAWMEGVLILATIGQRWRLRFLPGQKVDVQPKITLRPKYPMVMCPEPRSLVTSE